MIVGFTGTQKGMTEEQRKVLDSLLMTEEATEVHHGDCVGADAELHDVAINRGLNVVIHPPIREAKRAFCKDALLVTQQKSYLDRNKDIVDAAEVLIATPKEYTPQIRSGTWMTIRYAIQQQKRVIIIYPDGDVNYSGRSKDD